MNANNAAKPLPKSVPRHDWTEWHLTPRGWEIGSIRVTGKGTIWRDEPDDRLLSYVYRERSSAGNAQPGGASVSASTEESWRTNDSAKRCTLEECLARFGPCPRSLRE